MRLRLLPVLALWTLAACATVPTPGAGTAPTQSVTVSTAGLGGIAAARTARNAPPLRSSPALEAAARRHVEWIAATGAYGHRGAGGSSVDGRVSAEGYCWGAVGENIAYGIHSREAALGGWFASPAHRRNLLLPTFSDYGLAGAGGYWVMVLSTPC